MTDFARCKYRVNKMMKKEFYFDSGDGENK